ncbi:MAG: nitrate reductase cytochrome c-type subunit [Alphaproteobacteria bacterium]|nr:nitrate reductase cytochrome c-type subunit [Alphaproteobacteria bacterium]
MRTLTKLMMAIVLATGLAAAANAADVKGLSGSAPTELNAAPPVSTLVETKKWERTFRQQPPMVPHQVDKYQIDIRANECLKCHDWQNAAKEKAPELSESHYKDRDGKQFETVYGGRWFCTNCHAGQTDAKLLIENTFQSGAAR